MESNRCNFARVPKNINMRYTLSDLWVSQQIWCYNNLPPGIFQALLKCQRAGWFMDDDLWTTGWKRSRQKQGTIPALMGLTKTNLLMTGQSWTGHHLNTCLVLALYQPGWLHEILFYFHSPQSILVVQLTHLHTHMNHSSSMSVKSWNYLCCIMSIPQGGWLRNQGVILNPYPANMENMVSC